MKLKLVKKVPESGDIVSLYFEPDMDLKWKPGQYLRYQLPNENSDERGEDRFFSISSSPFEKLVRLTTRLPKGKISTFKRELAKLKIGDEVEAFGPGGRFSLEDEKTNFIFIAGGMGITPFRSILTQLDYDKRKLNVTLFYANSTENILFKKELDKLANLHPEFQIRYFITGSKLRPQEISKNIKMTSGRINKKDFEKSGFNFKKNTFYISGPENMVYIFEDILGSLGVPMLNIRKDYFVGYEYA